MKSRARKGFELVVATALFLGLSGTCALAISNPNNAILKGTYKAVGQEAGFSEGDGWLNAQLYGETGTLTFDGVDTCTAEFAGTSFGIPLGMQYPSVDIYPESGSPAYCYYNVNGDGSVTLYHDEGEETLWTNPDGTVIIFGGADSGPDEGSYDYETSQFVAIKIGSQAPTGTFLAVSQDATFWQGDGGVSPSLYGNNVTLKFNGTGGCSFSLTGKDYWMEGNGSIGVDSESESGTCTYVPDSDGLITVTIPGGETFTFQLGGNGNVILQGGATQDSDDGGTGYGANQMVAVKAGSNMTRASLQGAFRMVSQDASFWGSTVNLYGNQGILTFNGAESCNYEFAGEDYNVSLGDYPQVNSSAESDSGACTYSVTATGVVSLTHSEGTEKLWLSADGMTLISGGAKQTNEDGDTGYNVNQMVGVKISSYIGVNTAPVSLNVPPTDADGNYTVSWAATDLGVTYVLEEAKDIDFLTGLRTAYRGTNVSANITYRPKGQSYYYRVRSEKTGYEPSEWVMAENSCNVGTPLAPGKIIVPPKDDDGSYTISWTASLTPDVTYIVEEATDSAFTSPLEVYSGPDTLVTIENTTGTTYYYRVIVQREGFADSPPKKALNPCKVGLLAPETIYVPEEGSTSYEVSWDASLTPGVTYKLQEATNAKFTLGLRTLSTTGTSMPITGRKVGKTYYYRVQAVKSNYPASLRTTAANGCTVFSAVPE